MKTQTQTQTKSRKTTAGSRNEPEALQAHAMSLTDRVGSRDEPSLSLTAAAPPPHAWAIGHDPEAIMTLLGEINFGEVAHRYNTTTRALLMWIKATPDRHKDYVAARDLRAIQMVEEAHARTTALADGSPDNPHAVMARVKQLQWDASRSSKLYADKQVTETHSTLDISVTLQDAEMAQRLSALMGGLDPSKVIEGEIVE